MATESTTYARLIVLSGPSGVGKSTVLRQLLEQFPDELRLSVSATTRPPRPGEADGVDYYFLTLEEFQRRRKASEFLECFEVFGRGHWYGTLVREVRPSPDDKKWVILDIDVDGAAQVLRHFPAAHTIFLQPGSEQELERRLRARGTESEEAVRQRLETAHRELARAHEYKYQVVNDTVDDAVQRITEILKSQGIVT